MEVMDDTEANRPFASDSERIAAARESLTHLDAHLAAIDAHQIEATAAERAKIEGAVTALREFTD